jgi:hypothetical protein
MRALRLKQRLAQIAQINPSSRLFQVYISSVLLLIILMILIAAIFNILIVIVNME